MNTKKLTRLQKLKVLSGIPLDVTISYKEYCNFLMYDPNDILRINTLPQNLYFFNH